jgi:hypothetical protein
LIIRITTKNDKRKPHQQPYKTITKKQQLKDYFSINGALNHSPLSVRQASYNSILPAIWQLPANRLYLREIAG